MCFLPLLRSIFLFSNMQVFISVGKTLTEIILGMPKEQSAVHALCMPGTQLKEINLHPHRWPDVTRNVALLEHSSVQRHCYP